MTMHFDVATLDSIARIEALLREELATIELRQRETSSITEPGLRSLLLKDTEMHAQSYAELASYLREIRSLNEVTLQINEMFL